MAAEISIDDFKALTFEMYLAQREIGLLRQRLAELEAKQPES